MEASEIFYICLFFFGSSAFGMAINFVMFKRTIVLKTLVMGNLFSVIVFGAAAVMFCNEFSWIRLFM